MKRIYGIDLGTTHSLIAYSEGGTSHIVCDPETGSPLLPSVVSFLGPDQYVVGNAAKARALKHPRETIASVKRFMGLGWEHVSAEDRQAYPFASEEGGGIVRFQIHGRTYTPPEISALILSELKRWVRVGLGEEVEQVIITVPAYFNDSQRQATRDAGRLAGLDVVRLLNEPTAAALAYGLDKKKQGHIAVYDLGGGTFDISILHLHEGIFEVLSTSGDTRLGGDDMDRLVMDVLLEDVPDSARTDPDVLQAALSAAEQAKRLLSEQDETVVQFEALGQTYQRRLNRQQLEHLVRPIVERTLDPCRQALSDAGLSNKDLDDVVLVGGATRMPLVRAIVRDFFSRQPHTELDPDQIVALGAAVQAGVLSGRSDDVLLLDVVPLSLGIETVGGVMERIIERNTTIPCSVRQEFTTFVDNQTAVDFHVLQGERELAKDNRSLARFQLRGIEPQPAGVPRIEVTFTIDANGILNVTARDKRTGREQSVDVKPSYGLTDDEIERMLEESFEHAEEDVRQRLLIEARTDAESLLRVTRKQLSAAHVPAEEQAAIDRAVAALEEALQGEDYNLIRDRIEDLKQATDPLARRIMDEAIRAALENKRVDELA